MSPNVSKFLTSLLSPLFSRSASLDNMLDVVTKTGTRALRGLKTGNPLAFVCAVVESRGISSACTVANSSPDAAKLRSDLSRIVGDAVANYLDRHHLSPAVQFYLKVRDLMDEHHPTDVANTIDDFCYKLHAALTANEIRSLDEINPATPKPRAA